MKVVPRGIAGKLRDLRKHRGMTLAMLGQRTGYSSSALSKMENGRLGFTYDKLTRLAVALDVDLSTLFTDSPPAEGAQAVGRRSIARRDSGKVVSTGLYEYRYVSPELSGKQMIPIIVRINATTMDEFGPFIRHGGEEWIYVLKGEIEVHSEFYEPERLREGDSIYLDSRMGHAYLSKSKGGAQVLAVCSAPQAELLEQHETQRKLKGTGAGAAPKPRRTRAR